jgi:hypothetical protein
MTNDELILQKLDRMQQSMESLQQDVADMRTDITGR